MAFQTGTATNLADLVDQLRIFATANGWTELLNANGELILRGEGTGTDEIFVGIRRDEDVANDYFNLQLNGFTGYNNATTYDNQPGISPNVYSMFWDDTMEYWFVVSTRRIVVVAQVSTTYHCFHVGWILPYSVASEYPYPLYICGETPDQGKRFSTTDGGDRHFFDAGEGGSFLRLGDGSWKEVRNKNTNGSRLSDNAGIWPTNAPSNGHSSEEPFEISYRDNPDGSYTIVPLILYQWEDTPPTNDDNFESNLFGEIEGCFWVSGFSSGVESILNIGGVDHLVVQNIFRTGNNDYWALRLD